MTKPDWGTKRLCQGCGTKFYDFGRAPITCPKCGAEFDPEVLLKSRRSRANALGKVTKPIQRVAPAVKAVVEEDLDIDLEEGEEDLDELPEAEAEDDALIEDASELGVDEDVAEVVVGSNEEED
ncbi:MAG: TIGR02300 family protein [Kiloniellaceae bacterium]